MARKAEPAPGSYSNAVVDALIDVMANDRINVLGLSALTGKSNNYLSKRFRKELSCTLTDVEDICKALNLDCAEFLGEIKTSQPIASVTDITTWGVAEIDGITRKAALTDEEMDTDEH